jgi:hypothetical protein
VCARVCVDSCPCGRSGVHTCVGLVYLLQHPNFSQPPGSVPDARISFTVHHYAGKVIYNCTNFLEKNKDALHEDIRAVLCASSIALYAGLLPEPESTAKAGAKKKQFTLGTQFKMQLADLMTTLNSTEPHFVRCMKPNDLKVTWVPSCAAIGCTASDAVFVPRNPTCSCRK